MSTCIYNTEYCVTTLARDTHSIHTRRMHTSLTSTRTYIGTPRQCDADTLSSLRAAMDTSNRHSLVRSNCRAVPTTVGCPHSHASHSDCFSAATLPSCTDRPESPEQRLLTRRQHSPSDKTEEESTSGTGHEGWSHKKPACHHR